MRRWRIWSLIPDSGGLLVSLKREDAENVLVRLAEAGYPLKAGIVGAVTGFAG